MADESNDTKWIRREIVYSGRVQGVGFRYTTCHVAKDFDVKGYVRNLADGRVELVVEGADAEIDRFQCGILNAMNRNIRDVSASERGATGEFRGFDVRY